ncbi:tetratricopeptide repeat protein [Phragmitibacter flavus]|nr:tetratricopeptide repeat protein [Phragmitibacter flavus]
MVFPVWKYGFLHWEDSAYVTENPVVAGGLTLTSFKAALTTAPEANWMPFTWLAMAAQTDLAGPPPHAFLFRFTSLILHAFAGLLLWLLLAGQRPDWRWAAIIATATFLIHPQRVESVAWVSSQKDLWATLWILAAALCYSQTWTERPNISTPNATVPWRIFAGLFFALSLLSKPSGVSAPLLILVVESARGIPWKTALKRTVPFFGLSIAVVLISWRMNTTQEMLFDPSSISLLDRMTRALAIVSHHVATFLAPASLAPELVQPVPAWPWVTGGIAIILGILAALLTPKLRPVALPLFCWLILLVPISGIIPSPMVFTSDRMHHLPSLALSFAIAALFHQITTISRHPFSTVVGVVVCAVPIAVWSSLSHKQSFIWKDDETLFRHIVTHYPHHALAHVNLGVLALSKNDTATARQQFIRAATQGDRPLFSAWNNLLILQMKENDFQSAVATAQGLTVAFPKRAESWYLLGSTHRAHQDLEAALEAFQKADLLRPDSLMILNAMSHCLTQLNRAEEAAQIQSRIPAHLRQ